MPRAFPTERSQGPLKPIPIVYPNEPLLHEKRLRVTLKNLNSAAATGFCVFEGSIANHYNCRCFFAEAGSGQKTHI
jgi:hypothetical protein